MKIALLLSWYDESPSWLSTVVAGFGRFCDLVIGHDGAYALYPGARPRSHPEQAEAILRTAEAMEIGCFIYRPPSIYFGNEVEKRNEGLRIAGSMLVPGVDWLLVADADYHPFKLAPQEIRRKLAETKHDVASYTILNSVDFVGTELEERAKDRFFDTEWTNRTRDIYRWNESLRVGPLHWGYSVANGDGRRWLRGPFIDSELEPCEHLNADLVVYHRRQDRAAIRRLQADRYYKLREERGIESLEVT